MNNRVLFTSTTRTRFWLLACLTLMLSALLAPRPAIASGETEEGFICRTQPSSLTHDQIIAACTTVIQRGGLPDHNLAHIFQMRAVVYEQSGDHRHAIDDYSSAIQLEPTASVLYAGRGVARMMARDAANAVEDFNQAIQRATDEYPPQRWYFDHRGDAYFQLGNWAQAISDYSQALTMSPDYAYALYGRGMAKLRSGDTDGGTADINAALALDEKIASEEAEFFIVK